MPLTRARLPVVGLAGLVLLGTASPAPAADAPPAPAAPAPEGRPAKPARATPEKVADAVLAAVAAEDAEALGSLARQEAPDPWLVADALLARAQPDAADRFARAAPRKDTAQLPAYVAARRGAPDDPSRRQTLVAVNLALAPKTPAGSQAALDALGAPGGAPAAAAEGTAEDVVGIRLRYARGLALRGLDRASEAERAFLDAADAAERIGWLARATAAFDEAGQTAGARHDWTGAVQKFGRAARLAKDRGSKPDEARALHHRAGAQFEKGEYGRAQTDYDAARRLKDRGPDTPDLDETWHGLGRVHAVVGDYPRALEAYERALAAMGAKADPRKRAAVLGNLALVHGALGDTAKELACYDEVKATYERLQDGPNLALTWNNIGHAHDAREDYERALESYGQARVINDGRDPDVEIATLTNLGNVHRALGEPAKALEFHRRALKLAEDAKDRAKIASIACDIAGVERASGQPTQAVATLDRAIREADSLASRPLRARALTLKAEALLAAGEPALALAAAREGVPDVQSVAAGLGEEQGARTRERFSTLFAVGALSAVRTGNRAELARFLELGRAGTLLESLGGRQARRWTDVPERLQQAQADALEAQAAAEAAQAAAVPRGDRVELGALHRTLDAARARVAEVAGSIERVRKQQAGLSPETIESLESLEGRLAPGDALVLYGFCLEEAFALVVRADGDATRIVPLGRTADVEAACLALHPITVDEDPTESLASLRRRIVDPLALEADVRRILVSAEGALNYVPFAALRPDLVVATVPSGKTYAFLQDETDETRGERVLAVGDPEGTGLVPLPGSRAEAAAVGDVPLLGKEASAAGLLRALAKERHWRALHLACHGLVDERHPTLSALALSPDADGDGRWTVVDVLGTEIPADLVVLSACETGLGKVFRGEGIMGLTRGFMFAGTPRVICSLWKVDDEATRALMTKFYELWSPRAQPEDPERAKRVEGARGPGLPTAEALRKAQEFVRDDPAHPRWKHPYYWAAWVLWGLPS